MSRTRPEPVNPVTAEKLDAADEADVAADDAEVWAELADVAAEVADVWAEDALVEALEADAAAEEALVAADVVEPNRVSI